MGRFSSELQEDLDQDKQLGILSRKIQEDNTTGRRFSSACSRFPAVEIDQDGSAVVAGAVLSLVLFQGIEQAIEKFIVIVAGGKEVLLEAVAAKKTVLGIGSLGDAISEKQQAVMTLESEIPDIDVRLFKETERWPGADEIKDTIIAPHHGGNMAAVDVLGMQGFRVNDAEEERAGEEIVELLGTSGKGLQKTIDLQDGAQGGARLQGDAVDVAIQEGHDHRSVDTVAGHVAKEDDLAAVVFVDKVEKVAADAGRHTIFYREAAPAAFRGAFRQQQLLQAGCQIELITTFVTVFHSNFSAGESRNKEIFL